MEELNFERHQREVIDFLNGNKHLVLATCSDRHVTARTISVINNGLKMLFQTDRDFAKYQQIKENPNVALSCGNIQIEGRAQITGHPFENSYFVENYQRYHEDSFRNYSHLKDEVIIEVEPTLITLWKYDPDNKPFREYLMLEQRKAYREYYKKTI